MNLKDTKLNKNKPVPENEVETLLSFEPSKRYQEFLVSYPQIKAVLDEELNLEETSISPEVLFEVIKKSSHF